MSVIWRRPENQRWDRKMLTEMIGDPWKPTPQPKDKPPQVRGAHITLERQIKYGGHERLFGVLRASESAFAGTPAFVDDEAVQTAAASAADPNVETPRQAAGGPTPSSSIGPALAAGGPAPEDVNMEVAADSSAAQPTSSAVGPVGGRGRCKRKTSEGDGRYANPARI